MEWVGLRTVSRGGGFAASFALVLAAAACGGSTPSSSPSDQQSTRTYVVRSSAMEPTFHCAHGPGCRARVPDKVLASPITNPRRGEPVVYRLPPLGRSRCGPRWPVIGRVAALPGEAWQDSGAARKSQTTPSKSSATTAHLRATHGSGAHCLCTRCLERSQRSSATARSGRSPEADCNFPFVDAGAAGDAPR